MDNQLVGFIGVGRMGGPMSSPAAGRRLFTVCFRHQSGCREAARGAVESRWLDRPREVASIAQIVLMSLPTPTIVQKVALGDQGVVQGSRVKILVDSRRQAPELPSAVGQGVAERGITLVDSPVSGGVAGAKAGTLAVMVSCPKPTLAQVEPILKNLGRLFYTGEKPGLAQTAKLANNLLAAAALVVSSEALAMGVKAGLDPNVLARHHQRRKWAQQRHTGQVSTFDPAGDVRFRVRDGAVIQGRQVVR